MPTDREILDNLDTLTEDLRLTAEERTARVVQDGKWHTPSEVGKLIGVQSSHVAELMKRLCGESQKVKIGRQWHIAYRIKG